MMPAWPVNSGSGARSSRGVRAFMRARNLCLWRSTAGRSVQTATLRAPTAPVRSLPDRQYAFCVGLGLVRRSLYQRCPSRQVSCLGRHGTRFS
jgi:hypothetical protein